MKQLLQKRVCPMVMIYLLGGVLTIGCDSDSSGDEPEDSSEDSSEDTGPDNSNDSDNSDGSESATIDLEAAPCMATFTETYEVVDSWGDAVYTIEAGESLIIREFDTMFDETEVYYLNESGPYALTIEPNDAGEFPYETDCTDDNSSEYMGVFADTTIYADKELRTELCSVAKGKALPSSGYGLFWIDDSENGDSVYELTSNAVVEACGSASGYVAAPEVEIWPNQITWLIPIQNYLAKNE